MLAINQIILNLSDIESECFREISFHRYLEKKMRIFGFFIISDTDTVEDLVSPVSNKLEPADKHKVACDSLHGFKRVDYG